MSSVRNQKSDTWLCESQSGDSANWLSWQGPEQRTVKPDDHSEVVPLLPIPNRTVKRLSADDSADSRVKVGHRQANTPKARLDIHRDGPFLLARAIQGDDWI